MRYNEIVKSKNIEDIIWFHGSNAKFDKFEPQYSAVGHAKEGPGFYLTTDIDDARGYGSNVMKFKIKVKKLVPQTGKVKKSEAYMMMKNSPVLDEVLTNWDENPNVAFKYAMETILAQETPKEVFEQIWFDFYHDNEVEWLENMVKLGYTGILVPRENNVMHFICFDPEALINVI